MRARLALFALTFLVASCGGAVPPPSGPARTFPAFADRDPVDWTGRVPSSYAVHGVDVSRWQSGIDWTLARRSGISFAFIKATEGGDRVDPGFLDFWQATGDAGIARGAYHFFYFCRPAGEQARWFIEHVPRDPNALPPVLDMEWTPFSPTCTIRPPAEQIRTEALIFLREVERAYGKRPIIYTTPEFYRRNDLGQLNYPMWLRATARHPSEVYPGQDWAFWQYTGTGTVPGIPGGVDINAYHGSAADWQRFVGR